MLDISALVGRLGAAVPFRVDRWSGTMEMTEGRRHELHEFVKEMGGAAVAETLMDLLPPTGWADVATKRDLALLEQRLTGLEQRLTAELRSHVSTEISGLRAELHESLNTQTWRFIAVTTTLFAALFGLLQLV